MRIPAFFVFAFVLSTAGPAPWAGTLEPSQAQPHASGFGVEPDYAMDDITPEQRAAIWRDIDAQRAKLALPKAGERPAFTWPLRAARGFSHPGVDRVSNYVDHESAFPNQLRDYNCGTRTYDRDTGYNHQGIDISIWPDSWNMMETGRLEIVAAAPGTIVSKSDGNFDRNCSFGTGPWNAVYVQHDDGSIAWYGHMKNGSLTSKPVGARVVAGELLGTVGSSGNSTGPHLHFEVYDADKRLVDPFSGACNTRNPESWWAQQPAYAITRMNRVITASGTPVFSSCGSDGRMQSPGTINAKADFAPGELAYFVAFVRDQQPGQAVTFTIRRPDGSVWQTYNASAATVFSSGSYWWVSYTMPAAEPSGTWTFEAAIAGSGSATSFTLTPGAQGVRNYTDLWWNPAEPGWGINVNHQADTLFATWFTYDSDGSGMWLVMPDARGTANRMSGTIYRTTGTPFNLINGAPATTAVPPVGTGTIEFSDRDRGTFQYTLNGVTQSKTLQRQLFGAPTRCVEARFARTHATNYQDLWWNAAESGWGINLTHQGEIIFATWFTYGADGRGQWLVGSEVRRQPTGEFRGRLYRTTGRPFNLVSGSAATTNVTDVGEVVLSFTDGMNGRMTYSVGGVTQTKAITRQVFGSATPLCE